MQLEERAFAKNKHMKAEYSKFGRVTMIYGESTKANDLDISMRISSIARRHLMVKL